MNDLCYPHCIGGLIAWTNRTHLADLADQVPRGRRTPVLIRTLGQPASLAPSRYLTRLPHLQPRSQSRISSPRGRRNPLRHHRLPQNQLPSLLSTRLFSKVARQPALRNSSIACAPRLRKDPPPRRDKLHLIRHPKAVEDLPSYCERLEPIPLRPRRNNRLRLRPCQARASLPCFRQWAPRTHQPRRLHLHLRRFRSMRPHRLAALRNCSVQRQSPEVLPAHLPHPLKISRDRLPSYSVPWAALQPLLLHRLHSALRPPILHPQVLGPSLRCSR